MVEHSMMLAHSESRTGCSAGRFIPRAARARTMADGMKEGLFEDRRLTAIDYLYLNHCVGMLRSFASIQVYRSAFVSRATLFDGQDHF